MTDKEKAFQDGYKKCLKDVYSKLEKIRNSTSDFFIKLYIGEILLKLKYEFMERRC